MNFELGGSVSKTLKRLKRNDATIASVNYAQCGTQLSVKELRALCDAMHSNVVVTSLRLCNIGTERAHKLAASSLSLGQLLSDVAQFNTTLRRLTLDSMQLDGDDVAAIAASLATNDCLKLQSLHLADNPIEPHGIIAFAAMLMSNTTLKTLGLAGNPLLDSVTMQHVSLALSINTTLQELDLWKPEPFGDSVVTVLAHALKSNVSLRWLRLNASSSSHETIQVFADAVVGHNFVLSELDAFAFTTDELDAALKRNKDLLWPSVRSAVFAVAVALHDALPDAELIDAILLAANPYLEFTNAARRRRGIDAVLSFDKTRALAVSLRKSKSIDSVVVLESSDEEADDEDDDSNETVENKPLVAVESKD
jgi:hypothetical protein